MKYKKTYLLTRDKSDISDISTTIFPVFMSMYKETIDNNKSFALYGYDEDPYIKRLESLVDEKY